MKKMKFIAVLAVIIFLGLSCSKGDSGLEPNNNEPPQEEEQEEEEKKLTYTARIDIDYTVTFYPSAADYVDFKGWQDGKQGGVVPSTGYYLNSNTYEEVSLFNYRSHNSSDPVCTIHIYRSGKGIQQFSFVNIFNETQLNSYTGYERVPPAHLTTINRVDTVEYEDFNIEMVITINSTDRELYIYQGLYKHDWNLHEYTDEIRLEEPIILKERFIQKYGSVPSEHTKLVIDYTDKLKEEMEYPF